MSWFAKLIGTDKAIDAGLDIGKKVATGLIDGLDHLKFTDEEQAEHNIKSSEVILGYWDRYAKENTAQSKARRELALMSFKVFFFLILVMVAVYKFDSEFSSFIWEVVKNLTWLIAMIAGAYFVPYQVGKHMWRSKK